MYPVSLMMLSCRHRTLMGYPRAASQSLTRAQGSTFIIRGFPVPVRPVRHQLKCHLISNDDQPSWPSGFRCPRCDGATCSRVRGRTHTLCQCQACRHQTSLIAGTVMQGTKLPLTVWFLAIYLISQARTELSALGEQGPVRRR